jgi:prepilin-type N-terminal cleavage/methylation domain-containing protein
MKPNDHGFTLIEIVVVMVLISIVAAAVFTRSITTDELNLISRTDKIQNHIRYAQSMAMKTNEVWGIVCNVGEYWLFNGWQPADVLTGVQLPGETGSTIDLEEIGVHINNFFLFFDSYGKPYLSLNLSDPDETQAVSTATPLTITITSAEEEALKKKLSITPETGLIVVIQ